MNRSIQLKGAWLELLKPQFEQPYMKNLSQFLRDEKMKGKVIYPAGADIFAAFAATPLEQVKVVILGQDPYHGVDQAHGLCFSVNKGVPIPPSLRNIYQELNTDLGHPPPPSGFLLDWAKEGVLLLNSVLTVQAHQAASHQGKGWEQFTDAVIEVVNRNCEHVVFMLWGSYAHKKGANIDLQRHLVLKAPHPSPLSAHRGFFGCRHFSKANAYLESHGRVPIRWQLTLEQ
ncbi:MAG: uracil-DNA glycosylase [Pseudomonadota bacterium]